MSRGESLRPKMPKSVPDYRASLERRKIYVALRDAAAGKQGMLRIVDESGEEYLYPKVLFRTIASSQSIKKAVLAA